MHRPDDTNSRFWRITGKDRSIAGQRTTASLWTHSGKGSRSEGPSGRIFSNYEPGYSRGPDTVRKGCAREFLGELLEEAAQAFGHGRCTLHVEVAPDIVLTSARGSAVGLLVTELVINACKHAFDDGVGGKITVELSRDEEGLYRLLVEDDYRGLPAGFETQASTGLGMKLLRSFVRQLEGSLEISGSSGARFLITFPN